MKYLLKIYVLYNLLILAVETQAAVTIKEKNCSSTKNFKLEEDTQKLGSDCSSQKKINEELGILFKSSPPSEKGKLRFALLVGASNTRALNHHSPGTSFGAGLQYESLEGYETTFTLTQFQDIDPELIDTDRLRFWHESNFIITKDILISKNHQPTATKLQSWVPYQLQQSANVQATP